jgi:hypothetical protein
MAQLGFKVGDIHPAHKVANLLEMFEVGGNLQFKQNGWGVQPVFRDRDEVWINRLAPMFHAAFVFAKQKDLYPQVLYHAVPAANTPEKYAKILQRPPDQMAFLRAFRKSVQAGHVPLSVRVYLTSPSEDELRQLVEGLVKLRKETPKETAIPKTKLAALVNQFRAKRKIWAVRAFEIDSHERRGAKGYKKRYYNIVDRKDRSVGEQGYGPVRGSNNPNPRLKEINLSAHEPHQVADDFMKLWYGHGLFITELFYKYLRTRVFRLLANAADVDIPEPISFNKQQNQSQSVSPSHPGGQNERGFVVTANPAEKVHQQADGSYTRPELPPREKLVANIPEVSNFAAPIISPDGRFRVQVGLTFDSPLMGKKGGQTWWYRDIGLITSAAEGYARLTGDKPHLNLRILDKFTDRAVGAYEMNRGSNAALQSLRPELAGFRRQINTAVDQGRMDHHLYLKQHKMTELADYWLEHRTPREILQFSNKAPRMPDVKADDPTEYRKRWKDFIRALHRDIPSVLNIQFEGKTLRGKERDTFDKLKAKQSARKKRRSEAQIRWAGGKGEKWSIFLVEYLLAYGQSRRPRGNSVMIPITVLSDEIKRDTGRNRIDKVTSKWLFDNARKAFPTFAPLRREGEWSFEPGNLHAPLPYARLRRPGVQMNASELLRANAKYERTNIERTVRGYRINGEEYESFYMVVAAPGSVAHAARENKGLGLTPKGKKFRRLIDNPEVVVQAIEKEGLMPFMPGVQSIDPNSFQVKGERLRVAHRSIGAGPYTGKVEHGDIRVGTFQIRAGRQKGGSDIEGNLRGPGVVQGTIDYRTGEYTVVFKNPPRSGQPIYADYYVGTGISRANPRERRLTDPADPEIVRGDATVLAPGYYKKMMPQTHAEVSRLIEKSKRETDRVFYDYKRTTSADKKFKLYRTMMLRGGVLDDLRQEVASKLHDVAKDHFRVILQTDAGLDRMVTEYIAWADGARTIPVIVKRAKMRQWEAPFKAVGSSIIFTPITAPSEDVARLVLLYRMLRRSKNNPEFKKLALRKSAHNNLRVFPEINAMMIADWKRSRYLMQENNTVRNLRYKPESKHRIYRGNKSIQRTARGARHRYAHLWRHRD